VQADRREQIDEAFAGDIVGVIGPRASVTGDTLCDSAAPIVLETIQFPETVISMAIEPDTSLERKKLAETLEMMKRQDPTFRAIESEETGQTLISGMGELHLEVIRHRLERDFNLKCRVHKPRVSYKETLGKVANDPDDHPSLQDFHDEDLQGLDHRREGQDRKKQHCNPDQWLDDRGKSDRRDHLLDGQRSRKIQKANHQGENTQGPNVLGL
jgi:translation elongation factor EF-G